MVMTDGKDVHICTVGSTNVHICIDGKDVHICIDGSTNVHICIDGKYVHICTDGKDVYYLVCFLTLSNNGTRVGARWCVLVRVGCLLFIMLLLNLI